MAVFFPLSLSTKNALRTPNHPPSLARGHLLEAPQYLPDWPSGSLNNPTQPLLETLDATEAFLMPFFDQEEEFMPQMAEELKDCGFFWPFFYEYSDACSAQVLPFCSIKPLPRDAFWWLYIAPQFLHKMEI